MLLKEKVSVVPRFQRAIRIDTDLGTASALEGFICPESLKQSLDQICSHIEASFNSVLITVSIVFNFLLPKRIYHTSAAE